MKKFIILPLLLIFLSVSFIGCAAIGIKPPSSVCDNIAPGESLLCDLAKKNDLHLETVGNILMLCNFAAIEEGLYKADDALAVLKNVKTAVAFQPSGAALVKIVMSALDSRPMLAMAGIMVISPYLGYLDTPDIIKIKDQELLNIWLDQQIELLNR